jgi:hypothetical protein
MKNKRQHHPLFKRALSIVIACAILCTPAISFGWGAGGHMMTAHIAFSRLNPTARAKAKELLAIPINPAAVTRTSKDFVNASHWADDLRPFAEFDSFKPLHFKDLFFTLDGSALPEIDPNNIVKALEDNVEILKTSSDKNAQAQALRFVIHFVGDIHQPLHCTALVSSANPQGDQGGNLFKIKIVGDNGQLKDSNLHSYWDGGIGAFPRSGPNFAPPPLKTIGPAARIAMQGHPATYRGLKLDEPFNFDLWTEESFWFGENVVYKGLRGGRTQTQAYNNKALKIARQRVAWGGYRLAALLNAIWPAE